MGTSDFKTTNPVLEQVINDQDKFIELYEVPGRRDFLLIHPENHRPCPA